MSDIPQIDRTIFGNTASVKAKGDHIAVRFRYVTPLGATLANLIFKVIPFLVGYCLFSDLLFSYFQDRGLSPYPHAKVHLAFFYDIYSNIGDLLLTLFYVFVYDSQAPSRFSNLLLLIASGVGSTIILLGIAQFILSHNIAPWLLSPFISSSKTIKVYADRAIVGRKVFERSNLNSVFTRSPLDYRRSRYALDALEHSVSIFFEYGSAPVKIATVFGIYKAQKIASIVSDVISKMWNA